MKPLNEHKQVQRYDGVSQALHWVTAGLVVYAFTNGPGGSEARVYAPWQEFPRQCHETVGLFVFALLIVRVFWRRAENRPPPLPVPRWMKISAAIVQWALYILLFSVPGTAIAGAWLEGHPLTLLAGLTIPPPPLFSHAAGATISNLHKWLGDLIIWVGAFHALAALYHHIVLKDTALLSMVPRWIPLRAAKRIH
jgi:cytochrome b561